MSLLSTDYNSGSSDGSNGGSGDYEERDSLKLSNYAMVSFEISRINEYTGDYGQNVYIDLDDVEAMHGMVYDRQWDGGDNFAEGEYDDDTIKVFGFGKWFDTDENGSLTDGIDEKYINHRISESAGKNEFPYEFEELITEEDEENISLGNMSMKLTNGTKYRTILKVITTAGHDVIDDKDDDYNWADDENIELRDDLRGRRIVLFYKLNSFTPDGQDEEVTYTDAVLLDANTGAGITIQNGGSDSDSSSEDDDGEEDTSGTLGGTDADDLPEGVPEEADEIIDFMARTEETDPDSVESLVSGEADEYDLDAVIDEVERRME
jgi:hypothetical protein